MLLKTLYSKLRNLGEWRVRDSKLIELKVMSGCPEDILADAVRRVSLAMNATLELPRLLDLICFESARVFEASAAYIWSVEQDELVGVAGYGANLTDFIGRRISISDPHALGAQLVRNQQPAYVNGSSQSNAVNRALTAPADVRAILGVPLLKENRPVGALVIFNIQGERHFTPDDIEAAMVLGSHAAIAIENARMFEALQHTTQQLAIAYDTTLEGWARALELRDEETEGHSQRVTIKSIQLATAMGLNEKAIVDIRRGALLHDIGKMGIPDHILSKSGSLTDDEWAIMRQHPIYAHQMLAHIPFLGAAVDIPYCHHERWDGSGYPLGLSGTDIPLSARIFAVVDVWDALSSDRPYRRAWPRQKVHAYLHEQAGKAFDPQVVAAFLALEAGEHIPWQALAG